MAEWDRRGNGPFSDQPRPRYAQLRPSQAPRRGTIPSGKNHQQSDPLAPGDGRRVLVRVEDAASANIALVTIAARLFPFFAFVGRPHARLCRPSIGGAPRPLFTGSPDLPRPLPASGDLP